MFSFGLYNRAIGIVVRVFANVPGWLVSFIKWDINLRALFNTKSNLIGEQQWCYLTHTFPKGICPKVNVIAQVELKLAHYDSTVQRFNQLNWQAPWNNISFLKALWSL